MTDIVFDNRDVLTALQNLERAAGDLRPALQDIGETLTESTKRRFETKTGPDGAPWAPNRPATIERKGRDWPLTGHGTLMDTIHWQLQGHNAVAIGSPMEYAAMQQFGGSRAEFPWLWGDIPARPFLGVSEEDEADMLAIIDGHLRSALGG